MARNHRVAALVFSPVSVFELAVACEVFGIDRSAMGVPNYDVRICSVDEPPLTTNGQVQYAPGNPPPTVDQMAKDVSAFLVWTAEPNLAARHAAGLAVSIFLLFATILGYLAYQQIWHDAKRTVRVTGPLEPKAQGKTRKAKTKQGVAG